MNPDTPNPEPKEKLLTEWEAKIKEIAMEMRAKIKQIESQARDLTPLITGTLFGFSDKSETIEQSIIAMRHLEAARIRYGEVIQYLDWCISMYDK